MKQNYMLPRDPSDLNAIALNLRKTSAQPMRIWVNLLLTNWFGVASLLNLFCPSRLEILTCVEI